MGNAVEITQANFQDEVLNSSIPVLVDFWAPWCMPCRAIAPLVEKLASEYEGAKIGKVNVDENGPLATEFNIDGIPTILIFSNGNVVDRIQGMATESRLKEALDQAKIAG